MGMDVFLEDEDGNVLDSVADPRNILHEVLPPIDDSSFQLLRFIDWNGNTVFNRLQMPQFLSEWRRIATGVEVDEAERLLGQIETLALRCQEDVHLYIRFEGD